MLNRSGVAHYLLQRGLVAAGPPLDPDWCVEERLGRHRILAVDGLPCGPLVLKLAGSDAAADRAAIHREAAVYRALRAPAGTPPGALMPDFLDWDAQSGILVLAATGATWAHRATQDVGLTPSHAAQLAAALALLHAQPTTDLPPPAASATGLPWVLRLPRERPPAGMRPPAVDALLDWIIGRPGVCAALARLAASWRADVPIHGDIRAENCLLDDQSCRLIDWESCAAGDPDWDHAAVTASALDVWLAAGAGGAGWGQVTRAAAEALRALRCAIAAYRAVACNGATPRDWTRVTAFAGACLLQRACEQAWSETGPAPSHEVWRRAALGEHLLRDPGGSADALFAKAST